MTLEATKLGLRGSQTSPRTACVLGGQLARPTLVPIGLSTEPATGSRLPAGLGGTGLSTPPRGSRIGKRKTRGNSTVPREGDGPIFVRVGPFPEQRALLLIGLAACFSTVTDSVPGSFNAARMVCIRKCLPVTPRNSLHEILVCDSREQRTHCNARRFGTSMSEERSSDPEP